MKLKFPNVPVILRGWIKAAFLRYCWHHELAGTEYDPEQMAKGIMVERLNVAEAGGMEMIMRADPENPFRVLLDSFARFALVDAPNYREFNMTWLATEKTGEDLPVIVTIQRRLGLSPHEARQKAERELREYKQRTDALLAEGSAKIEELRAERDEHARIAAGLAIDLGEARGYAAKLEDLIQHWHVYLNYRGAAAEKLTEQQRELFAEVWRKHNEKVDAEEAAAQ